MCSACVGWEGLTRRGCIFRLRPVLWRHGLSARSLVQRHDPAGCLLMCCPNKLLQDISSKKAGGAHRVLDASTSSTIQLPSMTVSIVVIIQPSHAVLS